MKLSDVMWFNKCIRLNSSLRFEQGFDATEKYVWKAAADNFEVAKSTVQRLASASPGEYMIFSQTTGNKIVVKNGLPEPGTASPHARP
jgi:hypothetical protein